MDYLKVEEEGAYELIGTKDYYICTVPFGNIAPHSMTRDFEGQVMAHKEHLEITNKEHGKFIIKFNVEDKFGNAADKIRRTVIVQDTLPPVITLALNNKLIHHSKGDQMGHAVDTVNNVPVHPGSMVNPAGYANPPANSPGFFVGFGNPNMRLEADTRPAWKTNSATTGLGDPLTPAPTPYPDASTIHQAHIASTVQVGNTDHSDEAESYYQAGTSYSGSGKSTNFRDWNAVHELHLMAEASTVNGWIVGAVASAVAGVALLSYSARTPTATVPV
jgi:hypothetical protein